MNRYRNAPGLRAPATKASASTLCQKCLKRGHYSYECKASAQERPYISRPSRTQQLQNPRLRPQLSSDVPNNLLNSKGVADEILAKREEGRGRQKEIDSLDPVDSSSKRSRSISSHSVSSVSTISTNRSRSRSPPRRDDYSSRSQDRRTESTSRHAKPRKRRYSDSSSGYSSYSSGEDNRSRDRGWTGDRNTRRRRRESSPDARGRARDIPRGGDRPDRMRSHSGDRFRGTRGGRSDSPNAMDDRAYSGGPSRSYTGRLERQSGGRDSGPPQPPRERSLSPFSKRLALTQAMNMSR
ncbi:zinc knuckle-domain-containing protein [Aspergillus taichungensis]|uniref:Zinc knuckle-domain-containing protein n=1 Tax=Aspergillus taichungensis TaxID=482145 RepID=A0A2J5HUB0_9EURO|nr:zinc knuckle-domain-containing protein [Aspergillus taichungensis]